MPGFFVGCAGWSLRKELADAFPKTGTHLERYAGRFNAVEINSSFYRSHRLATYERWAASTPAGFRFAVKMPKEMTHGKRLVDVGEELEQFVSEVSGLGDKLAVILIQLPPSLRFEPALAERFFKEARAKLTAAIAFEPRHPSWFEPAVEPLLCDSGISRVVADPRIVPAASEPGGSDHLAYFRLHGSPRMYYSAYDDAALENLAARLRSATASGAQVWCIFDNTAEGAATLNALQLNEILHKP